MTTYELRDYHRDLETAIAFFDRQIPVPPVRNRLQPTLDCVTADQTTARGWLVRDHVVTMRTIAELDRVRRELAASWSWPGSVRPPTR